METSLTEFTSIGIVGIVLSLVIEVITRFWATKPLTSKVIAVIAAVIVGVIYTLLRQTVWWTTILAILGAASTVYSLFFNSNKA